ncbi:MAG: hypothetical protein KDC90_18745, partial [Ignavibacteriae bacterium]|nr:hypothetical protein [Ignavibacteriota bacterium]
MGGKASLLILLGFSTIMILVGLNMNRASTSAVDNSSKYYEISAAKEISRSGINLALNNLSRNNSWVPSKSPYSYMGKNNLEISVKDTGGVKIVTAIGTYADKSRLIEVKINQSSFSEYAYFSNIEGNIWWSAKDSVSGPFHTNDDIQVQGHPFFAGPRTSHGGKMKYYTDKPTDDPTIVGTYTPGVKIELPKDGITKLATSAGSGGYVFNGAKDVYLEFAGDSIKYKMKSSDPYITVLATDMAPNGVIYVDNGDLHLQGTVKNKWSVGSDKNVYLDDDIVYSNIPDPMDINDPSKDLLGILAKKDVIITDNAANKTDINIHAAIYCETGSLVA